MLSKNSKIIKTIFNSKWKPQLMKLFGKVLSQTNISQNEIEIIINNHNTDKEIIDVLVKHNKTPIDLYSEKYDRNRAIKKWKLIKSNLKGRVTSLLDMGGNVGNIAHMLGRVIMKLPKENTIVVDINDWEGQQWTPRSDITFVHYDDIKTIPDKSIDLITVFHTLHHINKKDYTDIINQYKRIITPNGIIVLYEHDCSAPEWNGIIDIEHILYDVVVSKKKKYIDYVNNYYSNYMSKSKWEKLFKLGEFKKYKEINLRNIDNSFYMFFKN